LIFNLLDAPQCQVDIMSSPLQVMFAMHLNLELEVKYSPL